MRFDSTLTTLVTQTLSTGAVPALMGEPGIGKSSFVEALAAQLGTEAFVLPCNQLGDKADLTGARLVPYKDAEGKDSYKQVFYPHQVITEAIEYANTHPDQEPILFLDEINRTTSDVTSGVLTLVTLRRMGFQKLPKNLRLMVAGNDKGNITSLDEASVSRFVLFRVEPDAKTLIELLASAGNLNVWVEKVLTQHPGTVFGKFTPGGITEDEEEDDDERTPVSMAELYDEGEKMSQLTTPRTIENLSRWLNTVDNDELATYLKTEVKMEGESTSLLNEMLVGFTGDTAFTRLLLAEIADGLTQGQSKAAVRVNVPNPAEFAQLSAATTMTDLDNLISGMSQPVLIECLMQAVHARGDQSRLAIKLSETITAMPADQTRLLLEMIQNDQVNRATMQAVIDANVGITAQLKPAISAYLN